MSLTFGKQSTACLGSTYCCLLGTFSSLWSYLKAGLVLLVKVVPTLLLMECVAHMHTQSLHVLVHYNWLFATNLIWLVVSFWDMGFQNQGQLDVCTLHSHGWERW